MLESHGRRPSARIDPEDCRGNQPTGMRYFSLACDYDSTLADQGSVRESTVGALRRLAATGRKLILVTGRELNDLLEVFPAHEVFDRIVAENGAILYNPAARQEKALAEPPSPEFIEALRQAGVQPLSVGASIVSTSTPQDARVLRVIHDLGLEMQVIYNRGAVMVLPSGVNKGTGLRAALADLGLSAHNTVAVGDAENDHALLNACECRVAVANAIATLKDRADLVTSDPDGRGVEQLIDKLLFDDLRSVEPRTPRYPILLGHTPEGKEVAIKSYGLNLLIAGPSASGKSSAVTAILERLLENGYQVCLIDPEGDYGNLERVIALGSAARAPDISEISAALEKPKTSVSISLLGLAFPDRPSFFASLVPRLEALRARTGRPHWIIVDEAHHLLPASWDAGADSISQLLPNFLLITVRVSSVLPAAVQAMRGIIAVGPNPEETIQEFSRAVDRPSPVHAGLPSKTGEVFAWFLDDPRGLLAVQTVPSRSEIRRHKRKYAEGRLAPEISFFFKGPDGKLNLRAHNLMMFNELAQGVDDETWLYHLRRNEYSKWMRESIKDEALASEVADVENDREGSAEATRKRIIAAIGKRYTGPETLARA
jgi:HAD superfamily hydrolase (TIGR01484 family)